MMSVMPAILGVLAITMLFGQWMADGYAGLMIMRMDELGPQHAGRTIAWRVSDQVPGADQYVPVTRKTLVGAKVVSWEAPSAWAADLYPDGVVCLTAGNLPAHTYYVGEHWAVDVEDAA